MSRRRRRGQWRPPVKKSARSSQHGAREARGEDRYRQLRLETLEARLLLAADLSLVGPGLTGGFFAEVQQRLNTEVLVAPTPLIGSQLATAEPGQFMDAVDSLFTDRGFNLPAAASIADVRSELTRVLDGVITVTSQGDPIINVIGNDGDTQISFELTLAGVVDTAAADELTFQVDATLQEDVTSFGRLGVFTAVMKSTEDPSLFGGTYTVDVGDHVNPTLSDDRLPTADYAQLTTAGALTGAGDVHLQVTASFLPEFLLLSANELAIKYPTIDETTRMALANFDRGSVMNLKVMTDVTVRREYDAADTDTSPFGRV